MLVLPAELTHKQAAACLRMLSQATHTAHEELVIADVSALVRFDSSALAVLLQCRRACLRQGKRFAVHGMPPRLGELAYRNCREEKQSIQKTVNLLDFEIGRAHV